MTSKLFDHTIFLAVRGDFRADNSPPNACINHLMDGKLNYTLTGPVAVVSEAGHGRSGSGSAQHFQPCDLRILIDFLFNYGGKPHTEIGHGCGDQTKGSSLIRFVKFLRGKDQGGKQISTEPPFNAEDYRTFQERVESFTDYDRGTDTTFYESEHRARKSRSSINLGSFSHDGSILFRPESPGLPDFLPDWIRESTRIRVGFPVRTDIAFPRTGYSGSTRSENAQSRTIQSENTRSESTLAPSVENLKTVRRSLSCGSMRITPVPEDKPISHEIHHVHQDKRITVRNSIEIFNLHNQYRSGNFSADATSIISESPSPSIVTTTSFFEPRPIRKFNDSLDVDRNSSFFRRPRYERIETKGQQNSILIMSSLMV